MSTRALVVEATCRVMNGQGGRAQATREFATFTGRLIELLDWLVAEGAAQVRMVATGVYWKPVWHVLEEAASLALYKRLCGWRVPPAGWPGAVARVAEEDHRDDCH